MREVNILDGKMLEQVENLTYLGSKITNDRKSSTDIISRIAQEKPFYHKRS